MSAYDPAMFPDQVDRTALDELTACYDSLGAALAALDILAAGTAAGDALAVQHAVAMVDRQVKEAASHLAPALRALLAAAKQPAPAEVRREAPAAAAKAPEPELPGFPEMARARHAHATGNQAVLDDELRRWFVYRDPLSGPTS